MSRVRWWMIGAAIVLAAVAAAAAVPFLVPVDRYRGYLEDYIRSATGRDVQIAALQLHLWPRPHVRALDVRLMNPSGFPAGPAVEAQAVNLGVDLRALVHRQFQIRWVALDGVRINFLTNTAGRSNFELPAANRRLPTGRGVLSLAPIGVVAIRNVDLRVGAYDAARGQTTPSFEISGLAATSRSVRATAPDLLQEIAATVDLTGARLTMPALRVPVQVSAGTLTLANGGVKASIVAALDETKVTGTADVPRIYEPVVSFALAGTALDVNRLRGLLTAQTSAPSGPAGPHRLVASGTVGVDRFTFAPIAAAHVRARVSVYTDVVRVDAYSLAAYGGTITGEAAVRTAAEGTPAQFTVHSRGVDVAALLRGVGGTAEVSGALDADGALATRMNGDPLAELTGQGTFAIRNGSFPGLDVKNGLVRAAKLLRVNVPAGSTTFSYFGGDARIARERVASTALRLDGDNLQATGSGSVGFDGSLNYRGTGTEAIGGGQSTLSSVMGRLGIHLPAAGGTRAVSIPFTLTGALSNPHFALAGMPHLGGGTAAPAGPQPAAPGAPQIPGLPGFLQNLPKIP
jgi:hypothetical protein